MNDTPNPSPPRRRRGGQPGNLNGLKHGFYSATFRRADLNALERSQFTGLDDEIALLRLFIRRVVELGANQDSLAECLNLLRILCLSIATLNRALKTQRLLAPAGDEVTLALKQALVDIHHSLDTTGKFPEVDIHLDEIPPDDPA